MVYISSHNPHTVIAVVCNVILQRIGNILYFFVLLPLIYTVLLCQITSNDKKGFFFDGLSEKFSLQRGIFVSIPTTATRGPK